VNYTDRTLLTLADPATRSNAFDQTALEQIVSAGYDVDAMGVGGPFAAEFDDFRLAVSTDAEGLLDGVLSPVTGGEQTQVRVQVSGLPQQDTLRVDALWRGAIVARFRQGGDPITAVTTDWPSLGTIDDEVKAANGGVLPADAGVLETARRDRFVTHMRTTLDQPALFDDTALDRWLAQVGAASVGDLLEHGLGSVEPGTATVTFAAPAKVPETPKPLPIAAAVFVRDAGFSLSDLLATSSVARERLTKLGAVVPARDGLRQLHSPIVVWVVPKTTFDDTDWPGGTPDLRRANAGAWLAREGIGLATTT
jgi:hypothetical protein